MANIDFQARNDCYALFWSYGEICCGCGCCSKKRLKRIKARYEYNKECLEHFKHQELPADPALCNIMLQNLTEIKQYHGRKTRKYRHKLYRLQGVL